MCLYTTEAKQALFPTSISWFTFTRVALFSTVTFARVVAWVGVAQVDLNTAV